MSPLLAVLLAVAGASWGWTRRGLTERRIAQFYEKQVDAFLGQDLVAIASQYAPDYRGVERQVSAGCVKELATDQALACKSAALLFAYRRKWEAQAAAGEQRAMRYSLQRTSTRIVGHRRAADVSLAMHLSFGDSLVVDATATDRLVWCDGRVLVAGSQAESRVGGTLAPRVFASGPGA